jgi:hypothetical protein
MELFAQYYQTLEIFFGLAPGIWHASCSKENRRDDEGPA